MVKKGYKMSEEQKKMIGLANARILKGRIVSPIGLSKIIKMHREKKDKFGYINSPETRERISNNLKKMWAEGRASEKQKQSLVICRNSPGNKNTRFKQGHNVPKKWREAVRKKRLTQIFPKKDTLIEIKIQSMLKELGITFITHKRINTNYPYQSDIFIPSYNLIMECDGDYWHGNLDKYVDWNNLTRKQKVQKIRDYERTKELEHNGFKVLRLWESDIKEIDSNKLKSMLEVKP